MSQGILSLTYFLTWAADLGSCLAALYRACQLTWGVALLHCTVVVCVAFEYYMDLHALSSLNVTKFNNDEDADGGEDDYDDAMRSSSSRQ